MYIVGVHNCGEEGNGGAEETIQQGRREGSLFKGHMGISNSMVFP